MPTYLDDVLARIPEERHADFLRLAHRFNIGPDSPDLISLVLQSEMLAVLTAVIRSEAARVESAGANLPDMLRAAAVPIVERLADDITSHTVAAVREDAKDVVFDVVSRGIGAHQQIVIDLSTEQQTAATSLTSAAAKLVADASAAVDRIEANTLASESALKREAERLGGWSPLRITSAALGAIVIAGSFVFGFSWCTAEDTQKCSARVDSLSSVYHLTARENNMLHHQICGW